MPSNAGSNMRHGVFSYNIPSSIRDVARSRSLINSDGIVTAKHHAYNVSRLLSKILRHSKTIRVNTLGFAWVQDVAQSMESHSGCACSQADIFFAVARDQNSRFQVVGNESSESPYQLIIRAV